MIELDGSMGEGGGQILRTSLALSLITGRPFRLTNVRAGRDKPGLRPQHLTCVRAAAAVGSAKVKGDAVGSRELTFEPGPVRPGDYHFPIGTAGATGLVLHTVYLPLAWQARGPSTVRLEGGTHNDHAPCYHFNEVTWRRYLERVGLRISMRMDRPGFYPRGGGKVEVRIEPCQRIAPLTLMEGTELTTVTGFSAVAGLPDSIARRQADQATSRLEEAGLGVSIRQETWPGRPGTVLGLWFHEAPVPTLFFGLGARGKRAEAVADEAVNQALAYRDAGAPVDLHSADQIALPLALSDGESRYRVSEVTAHLTTNLSVIGRFLRRRLECIGAEGQPGEVHIGSAD